ncbi:patatin-like phospholipase family protein [Anaerolentibacter hominis]|uniref:patatin-like phospholipase family protein n=1 Tax=Anaerolentibacter hominis TaxID=3079009 RepID=UPI0031B83889
MLDLSKEYGLVLEGGGAKGAYQIGVWKALRECGIRIKAIAGVSVGALNGALITMGDYETAENIWTNIQYSSIMDVKDDQMQSLMHLDLKSLNIRTIGADSIKFLSDRGFDITPLKNMISTYIDEDKIRNSPIEFMLGTFSLNDRKEVNLTDAQMEPGYIKDYLLASAYLPFFKSEELHGKRYLDGGVVNKVPLDMLINRGYRDIISVRIYGFGVERRIKIPPEVSVYEVAPRVGLGGIMDFDKDRSQLNLKIGYYDGMRLIRGLKGKVYYIQAEEPEEEYIRLLTEIPEAARMALIEWARLDYTRPELYQRQMFETVFPEVAAELRLGKDWTYQDLYIAMLELCAKALRIKKYNIYTIEGLITLIVKKYSALEKTDGLRFPVFVEVILQVIMLHTRAGIPEQSSGKIADQEEDTLFS